MTVVQAMFPCLRVLQLSDSNSAGMEKLYYYTWKTMLALEKSLPALNSDVVV